MDVTASSTNDSAKPASSPYREPIVRRYLAKGWGRVFPIGYRNNTDPELLTKRPPAEGVTGHSARVPTKADHKKWCREYPMANIGLHMGHDKIGIDVDQYGPKHGLDAIRALEEQAGVKFPPTLRLTSRGGKFEDSGGKLIYRLKPEHQHLAWPGTVGLDTEILQFHHRYAMTYPSRNPMSGFSRVRWYRNNDELVRAPEIPHADECAFLSDELVAAITGLKPQEIVLSAEMTSDDIEVFLNNRPEPEGEPCSIMRRALDKAVDDLAGGHEAMRDGLFHLVALASESHRGIRTVLDEYRRAWFVEVTREVEGGGFAHATSMDSDPMRAYGRALNGGVKRVVGEHGETSNVPCSCGAPSSRPRFVVFSARDLAEPVPPMEWLVEDVWPLNSFGPMGGEKKTLKTYNLLSLSVAVASGEPFFGRFKVSAPGPVLYLVGEGGRIPFQRRLQRVAEAYEVDLAGLPFGATFDTAALDSDELRDVLARQLDHLQPALVVIDPLYAFHPAGVEATNLYERGRMLAAVSGAVADQSALIIADHFNKTGSRQLDLDSIAQAGMAQWADSWILQRHHKPPELATGTYRLAVEFGSRQWGGARYSVDWFVPNPGEDLATAAPITWQVEPLAEGDDPAGVGARGETPISRAKQRVLDVLADQPFELTKNEVVKLAGGNAGTVRDAIAHLIEWREVEVKKVARPDASGRSVSRDRLGPAEKPGVIRPRRGGAP
ncbi:AAA family ATPase [Pseudonocardia sp. D17]|uniref:AAA family ATPase n=1 Tax=Pseudonocardia sp. D17 TaxID=882661 RepID=UPI002B3D9B20|nr:hypothetical protein PSD17_06550 [Pseudonocardia sp. D17]